MGMIILNPDWISCVTSSNRVYGHVRINAIRINRTDDGGGRILCNCYLMRNKRNPILLFRAETLENWEWNRVQKEGVDIIVTKENYVHFDISDEANISIYYTRPHPKNEPLREYESICQFENKGRFFTSQVACESSDQ